MKALISALALSLAVASLGSQASAAVAYSNFGTGPGDTYNNSLGVAVKGSGATGGYYAQACSFVSLVSGTVDSYDLAGSNRTPGHLVTLNLLDAAPWLSSNTLDSVSVSFLSIRAVLSQPSGSHPQLVEGQTYWLVMLPDDASTYSAWNLNNTGVTGIYSDHGDGWASTTYDAPAFSVQTSVPEPTCLSLIGVTAALVLSRRRAV